jgi:hypothetical protein
MKGRKEHSLRVEAGDHHVWGASDHVITRLAWQG